MPDISINITNGAEGDQTSSVLQILFIFVIIALVPTILLMTTSFTRTIIVLHFLRSALGTQQMPPNQVLVGISLIMTMLIMAGPLDRIYNEAYIPFQENRVSAEEFAELAIEPLRDFMLKNAEREDIGLFGKIAGQTITTTTPSEEIPTNILIPAFVLGELKKGFAAGFWLYIPFIVIDMVVASTLMAMGMMMLPPAMISLPFKIMVFVVSDGWRWILEAIAGTFKV